MVASITSGLGIRRWPKRRVSKEVPRERNARLSEEAKKRMSRAVGLEAPEEIRPLGFYSIPLIKYVLRVVHHVLYLLMYTNVLTHLYTPNQLERIAPELPPLELSEVHFPTDSTL